MQKKQPKRKAPVNRIAILPKDTRATKMFFIRLVSDKLDISRIEAETIIDVKIKQGEIVPIKVGFAGVTAYKVITKITLSK